MSTRFWLCSSGPRMVAIPGPELPSQNCVDINYKKTFCLGASYITSSHLWDFWTPLPPYVSMFLVLWIRKNWHFLTPLPPYKCWRNIWMVPYLVKRSQDPWTVVRTGTYDFFWLEFMFSLWPTFLSWLQVCRVKTLHYVLGLLHF